MSIDATDQFYKLLVQQDKNDEASEVCAKAFEHFNKIEGIRKVSGLEV
jgi:hypothetical protein